MNQTENLFQKARRWGRIVGRLPFVREIFVTGSVATGRADKKSDIDLMIICSAGRLWTTRLFVVGFFKITNQYRRRGKTAGRLCPNYWLVERCRPTISTADIQERKIIFRRRRKTWLEWILSGRPGEWLEKTAKKWQIRKITRGGGQKFSPDKIKVSDSEVYFHS